MELGLDAEDEAEGFWKTEVGEEAEDRLHEVLLHPVGGERVESEQPRRQWGVFVGQGSQWEGKGRLLGGGQRISRMRTGLRKGKEGGAVRREAA